jgi:hypothetical protein
VNELCLKNNFSIFLKLKMKIKLNKKEQIEVSVPASAWSGFKGTLIGMEVRGLEVYGYVLGKFPDSLKQRCYGGNIPPCV